MYGIVMNMRFAFISLVAIFLINLVGMFYNWYAFFWFDMALHFLGGFFVALLLFHYLKKHFLSKAELKNTLILVGAVMFIGVVWEFAEYIANQTLREPAHAALGIRVDFMGDINDTMTDLLLDMLGAFTLAGILKKRS